MLVLGVGVAPLLLHAQERADTSDAAARRTVSSALALQLEMAASDSFYLEIDPLQNVMRLRLSGVSLRDYPLLALQKGTPRVAFLPLGAALDVVGSRWPAGSLDPPRPDVRLELQPPDPNAPDSTLPLFQPPPSIEEMPVPSTYRIRYPGGLTLTVTSPRPAAAGPKGIVEAIHDRLGALHEAFASRRAHLRIVVERADAQHLFRSLPPGTRLLVLPG